MFKKLTSKVVVVFVMTVIVNLIVGCNNQQATMPGPGSLGAGGEIEANTLLQSDKNEQEVSFATDLPSSKVEIKSYVKSS